MSYARCWIHVCIVLYAFALNMELETNIVWLEDGIIWKKQQKKNKR